MEFDNYFNNSRVKPSGEYFYKCSALMAQIRDSAPSDSSIRALINKLEDGTHQTIINIKAAQGDFISSASQNSLVSSLKEAKEEIMDRLVDWKIRRFKHVEL